MLSSLHNCNLRNLESSGTPFILVINCCVKELTLGVSHNRSVFISLYHCARGDCNAQCLKVAVTTLLFSTVLLQIIKGDKTIRATVTEARIILAPVDTTYFATVAHVLLRTKCVEVVDVSVTVLSNCEHVAPVAETYLLAKLDLNGVILRDTIR